MKRFKPLLLLGAASLSAASCSDFLDTVPLDALSPGTTWKSETDAQKFAVGCYNGWESGGDLLYQDCASDYGYNNFQWEGYKDFANGQVTAANSGANYYNFVTIRRCNTFLEKITDIPFANDAVKKDLTAQVRFIRAYRYFKMNWIYGGVPLIENYNSAEEAKVPRNTEAEVRDFVEKELDECTADLNVSPNERGKIAKGAALALRMREALYYGEWETAKQKAEEIIALGQYSLDPDYANLFTVKGQGSKEIILAVQYIPNTYPLGTIGQMYNNGDGGWSSIVPTQDLIDAYEMRNGMTIDEPESGYDPSHPFKGRDPRMGMSVLYPGADYIKSDGSKAVFNTLDKTVGGVANANYMTSADNASKTGLTWNKYLNPITQYGNIWESEACPIVFRYAEVLLSWAEAENELHGPSDGVYEKLDAIRTRSGMPKSDRNKYSDKETLRELIHRERGVEFAGEGLRRADILRWKTPDGKMLAEIVLNKKLVRRVGTVGNGPDPETRATINLQASEKDILIENRSFKPFNRYYPLPQGAIDRNPKLQQNEGY